MSPITIEFWASREWRKRTTCLDCDKI